MTPQRVPLSHETCTNQHPAGRRRIGAYLAAVLAAVVVATALALVLQAPAGLSRALAAGCTTSWADPTTSGDWNVKANWSANAVPGSSDTVCLPQSNTSYTVTLAGDRNGFVSAQGLQVGSGATLEIDSGPVKGGADAAAVLSVGPVTNAGTITLQGVGTTCQQATLITSSGNAVSNSGTLTLAGSCSTGIVSVIQGTLNNSGAISVTGPSEFTVGTKTNSDPGTLDVTSAGSLLLNGGSFVLTGGTLTTDGLLLSNGAGFGFNGGTIVGSEPPLLTNGSTLTMGGAGNGIVIVRDNTTLTAGSSIGQNQAIEVDAGVVDGRPDAAATLSVAGDLSNAGAITLQWQGGNEACTAASLILATGKTLTNTSTGTLNLNGVCANSATAVIAALSGSLNNSGAVTSTGNSELQVSSVTMANSGRYVLAPASNLLLEGTGLTFDNTGTVELGAGSQLQGVANTFTNDSGGTLQFDVGGASAFGQLLLNASGRLNLAGTANPALQGGFVPTPGEKFQVITAPHGATCFTSVQQGLTADCSNAGFVDLVGATVQPLQVSTSSLPAGTIGQSYTATLAATGGTPTYSWTLANGSSLPAGLSLNAATGAITGTPTSAGSTNFTVKVTDSGTPILAATAQLSIAIAALPLAITTTVLPDGTVEQGYSNTLLASGGTIPYSWMLVTGSSLPVGLSLNSITGAVTGTPGAAGTKTFTVNLSDAGNPIQTTSVTLSLAIDPATLAIVTTALPGGTVAQSYNAALTATGGTTPYAWSLAQGSSLPAGLSLNGATGMISGTPASAGTATFTVNLADAGSPRQAVSAQLSIVVAPAQLVITTTSLPGGTVGQSYSATLTATGGTPPYTWSLATNSTLPGGLSLNAATGAITGSPTTAGAATSFTIVLTDAGNPLQNTSAAFSITTAPAALVVATTSLPAGIVGVGYGATLTASGGTPSFTWSLASGSQLPAGLSLSAGGGLSGAPTSAGTTTFTVHVADSGTPQQTASAQLSIAVAPVQLRITTTALPGATVGQSYSATLAATGGTTPYTWALASGSSLPAGLSLSTAGVISGTPHSAGFVQFSVTVTDAASPVQNAMAPLSIAIAPGAVTRAYVANFWVGTVSVLDAATNQVAATITIGSPCLCETGGVAASPDGSRVYVTNNSPYPYIAIVDTATNQVIGRVTAGSGVRKLAVTPDGARIYAVDSFADSVSVVDTATYQVLTTISVGRAPFDVAITPDGSRAYVTNSGDSTVSVIDTTTNRVAGTISGVPAPYGAVVTPTGTRLYVADLSASKISAIDTTTNQVTATIPVGQGPEGIALSPDGTRLYAASILPGAVAVIDTATNRVVATTRVGGGPLGIAASPDGTKVYVTNVGSGTISVINTATNQVSGTTTVGASPVDVAFATIGASVPPGRGLTLTTFTAPGGKVGQPYSTTLAATGGTRPYHWALLHGTRLPAGLTLDPVTGDVSGTPTAAGRVQFEAGITDSSNPALVASAQILIVIAPAPVSVTIAPFSLPQGRLNAAYSAQLSATGGTRPYTFTVTGGSLPPGLSLGAAGAISGRARQRGSFSFTVTATDRAGNSGSRSYTVLVV